MTTMDDIYARVAEGEEQLARAKERGRARAGQVFLVEIEPGLGTLSVDGYGRLHKVTLDPRNLAHTSQHRLAESVVTAINLAESMARNFCQESEEQVR